MGFHLYTIRILSYSAKDETKQLWCYVYINVNFNRSSVFPNFMRLSQLPQFH